MIIAIASGKGGTGKTTIAVNLAIALKGVQYLDCDVEEPNGHLFLNPRLTDIISVGIPVPSVDDSKCTYCGKCAEVCEFNAIVVIKEKVLVFPELCHGCGACSYICPEDAIEEVEREIGVVKKGEADGVEVIYGLLNIGEAMAPPLIKKVKQFTDHQKIVILDSSPGTSCPVVVAVRDSDFCLLVTEPTPFGLHDLTLAVEVVRKLKIPLGIVINRSDVGDGKVWEYCKKENIPILMEIPHDRKIAESYSKGIPLLKDIPGYRNAFKKLYQNIKQEIKK